MAGGNGGSGRSGLGGSGGPDNISQDKLGMGDAGNPGASSAQGSGGGGGGGAGPTGGAGGNGGSATGGTIPNTTGTGGLLQGSTGDTRNGGNGVSGLKAGDGGGGGGGGGQAAPLNQTDTRDLDGIYGGDGGHGGNGVGSGGGGGGGAGGYGVVIDTTVTGKDIFTNVETRGGHGGAGGTGFNGGAGGSGGVALYVSGSNNTIRPADTLTGGDGGVGGAANGGTAGAAGAGGVGLVATGGRAEIHVITVSGGLSGDGATRADAIDLAGGGNKLYLNAKGSITGDIRPGTGNNTIYAGLNTIVKGGLSGSIADFNSKSVLTIFDDLTLAGASTYTGAIVVSNGTLQIGTGGTTGSLSSLTVLTLASASSVLAIDRSDALTLSNTITGSGGFNQIGTGTTTLSGNDTYLGGTTINGGTLLVTGSLAADSTVAVNAGAALGGTGTVAGSVTVNTTGAGGGTISAGATALSDIGTLSTGALTLSGANAVFREDVTNLMTADKIVVKGAVTLAGTLDLHLGKGFASSAGQGFVLIDNDNPAKGPLDAVDGSFTSLKVNDVAVTLSASNTFAFNNHTYQIDYRGGDGNDVAIRDVTAPPVSPAPPPPSLQQDTASGTGFAQAITGNALTNDANASSLQLAAVQFAYNKAVSVPASGSVQVLGDHGLLTVSADGSYRYQPTSLGGDAFTETVRNADGGTAQTTLSFNVAKAAIPASVSLAFALTDATFDFRNGHDLVTAPNGTVTDLTGVGTISFTDGTVQEKDSSPLVDDLYYAAHNLDVWRAHVDPDTHYASFGWKEGRDPSAVFSTKGYLTANPDVAGAGTNPLNHYDQFGWHEGRSPSPNFSAEAYLAENPDVARAGVDPLAHYLTFGQAEDRFVFPGATVAQGSGDHLYGDFDATFYLKTNTDVAKAAAASGINADSFAFTHFLTFGANEGRDPDAYFSTKGYLAANPDVATSGFEPLLHYQLYGWREGRDPSQSFHTQDYLAANPDVAAAHIDPLQHYLQFGMAEGRHLV